MVQLTQENIRNLSCLCQITCNPEEEIFLVKDLMQVIAYMDLLQTIDTGDIEPCNHVVVEIFSSIREDTIGPVLSEVEFLSNVPCHKNGMVCVPLILKLHG